MRKIIDNVGVPAGTTKAMLDAMQPFARADLISFQLPSGTILRFAAWDWPVTFNGNVYSSSGPHFRRDTIKHKAGVEVDDMTLQLLATEANIVQGSMGWATAAREGVLDGALFSLDLAFFALPLANTGNAPTPTGFMNWYSGYVDEIRTIDPPLIEMGIKNDLGRLAIQMPRNYYQMTCNNTLYDRACGLAQASYAITGTVTAVNGDGSLNLALSSGVNTDNWFKLGSLYWQTGANAGLSRGIKNSASLGTVVALYQPMPNTIAVGDTCTLYPGCDKTRGTCNSKFQNVKFFRGTPFVPQPEVVL